MTNQEESESGSYQSIHSRAEEATGRVSERINAELDKTPELYFLMDQFGSYVYNAGQKLIDLRNKTRTVRGKDEAVIYSCPRLFNDCFAGYNLAKSGIVLQAIVLLRSAFEVTTQAIAFMENEGMAKKWLDGKRIEPREVRKNSQFVKNRKELYDRLSRLSHPNLEALLYYAVPLSKHPDNALVYGGGFFPKAAGQISTQFLFTQLVFLEAFYTFYEADLEAQNLLWRPGVPDSVRNRQSDITWPEYLATWRNLVHKLANIYNALPDDAAKLSEHLNNL